jgi:hypothetical protein
MAYNEITIPQIKCINVLIAKSHLKDHKAEVIQKFTGNRATSTKDMNRDEAAALIGYLKNLDGTEAKADKMRKKVLSMAHEMGWRTEDGKVNMDAINNWCMKYGYMKKRLDAHTYFELPRLVSQFEIMYKDFLKKI